MIDTASYAKAKVDWTAAQELAHRCFQFEKSRRAFLQTQSARITRNVDEMERLEKHDALVFGPQHCDAAGRGRWPYA